MFRLGIDLGGTKIEGVILDPEHDERFRKRIPTEQKKGYQHILHRVKHLYDSMVAAIDKAPHTFGIGTPGAISPKTGLLRNSNTVCLNEQPVKEDLEQLLNREIVIQNDANCFAMAEALKGAGLGKNLVFGVIMGTGCGGGIIYKGEVVTGIQAIAGEWGHMTIDPNGPECWCGSIGCVETLISGGGLEKLYSAKYSVALAFSEIMERYRKIKQPETDFVREFFENFGRAMGNLINILDPDIVVLGGGLSNIDELYTEGVAAVERWIFSDYFATPIVRNQLGDSAGVIGAALIGQ